MNHIHPKSAAQKTAEPAAELPRPKLSAYITYLLVGIFFGIVLTKSEAISWYRIQEMFRFQAFKMYGIIGVAVGLGAIAIGLIKKWDLKTVYGSSVEFIPKKKSIARYFIGGSIFGLGWAMTGACPGPMYVLVGNGILPYLLVIVGAILGTYTYGLLRDKLPH